MNNLSDDNNQKKLKKIKKLPLLIVNDAILFPKNKRSFFLETEQQKKAIEFSKKNFDNLLLLVDTDFLITDDKEEKIAVLAQILFDINDDSIFQVKLSGISCVFLSNFVNSKAKKCYFSSWVPLKNEIFDEKKEQELTERLMRSITDILEKNKLYSISNLGEANAVQIIDFIIQNSREIEKKTKLELLREVNPFKRLETLINLPDHKKIEREISEVTRKNIQRDQETYYLLRRKEAIEKRLKESQGAGSEEMRSYLEILNKEPFPLRIKQLVYQKIEQYEQMPSNSSEAVALRIYISWVMKTPWWRCSEENENLKLAREKLDAEHFGLEEIKERIIEYLAVQQRAKNTFGQIICLIGPPGVGKTSLARSIAAATGREFVSISLGGVSDEAEIRGHRSTYVASYPGRIIKSLIKAKTINPLILIDEIDKIGHSPGKGSPLYALMEVLDTSVNERFIDNYLGEEAYFDLSRVFFVCTANSRYDLPWALLDRLEILTFSSYSENEKVYIAQKHLIPEFIRRYKLENVPVNFSFSALLEIIKNYTREAGVRSLRNRLDTIFRKFIVRLNKEEQKELSVSEEVVGEYLKKKNIDTLQILSPRPGLFNGLSYNSLGSGDVLPIEVACYPKREKHEKDSEFTGNLGEMIKESCQIALAYIRSNSFKFKIEEDFFEKNCIHINIVEGSISKDGTSAGVALTTAIISAVTKIVIPREYAATGEITLHGWVGAIGGLKEKIMAAQRRLIKTVFIPKDNEIELKEIPSEVLEKIKIIPVKNYDEVWEKLFKEESSK